MAMARERKSLNHPKEGTMSMRKLTTLLAVFTLAAPLMFYGCEGDDGAAGPAGKDGTSGQDASAPIAPESCVVCHGTSGAQHQASYDQLYQDNVINVSGLGVAYTAPNVYTTTFTMTKKDSSGDPQPFNCENVQNLNAYIVSYTDNNTFEMPDATIPPDGAADRLTLKPSADIISPWTYRGSTTIVGNGTTGLCTVTGTYTDNVADFTGNNGLVVVYGFDEQVGSIPSPSRVKQVKFPYAAFLTLGTVDYASAANVEGCEKCHTVPFLKHGNIYGRVNGDPATDMYTCKACHLDNGAGGHFIWQLLVDDTERAAELWAQAPGNVESLMDNTEKAKYAYKTRLMNDVHMSHAMEFEYPQSMATCNTCHGGKLDKILTDNNFTLETCKSCHAVTGSAASEKPQPALADILPATHFTSGVVTRVNCYTCHTPASGLSQFTDFHTGYDKKIYGTDNGVKYSSAIVVTIDNASFVDNTGKLTFQFSATGTLGGLSATAIKPTVLVGLYGWDTKDYLFGPHERSIDTKRDLEYKVGQETHPRFTFDNTAPAGTWKVTADLSNWADNIAAGNVKRVEIAVMPWLEDPALPKTFTSTGSPTGDNVVALNAPSRTFVLGSQTLQPPVADDKNIVKVTAGCNNCHDALAVNFHTPDRGGNIIVCRLCHITKAGGSHLEMQSRSIDSYAHAIHSFQAFDIGGLDSNGDPAGVNFADPVESMFYDLKIESHFPTFDLTNCQSCHNAGKFNVPDQAKSLPGLFSASDDPLDGKIRAIQGVPMYIAGPASRACGACHRAEWIKEDDAVALASFNQHTRTNGYLVETTSANAVNDLYKVFDEIMANFTTTEFLLTP
jgi:OmcA/MtrC family decaheme c-type cytochrome